MKEDRILEQLDRMVETGRITQDEADRLCEARGTARFDEVMGEIRARHAGVHTDAAVAGGRMSPDEADELLDRVRAGDHSGELRAQIRRSG
jgi:polyhydroxyalkanoate synthesis regulator phasin